MSRYWFRQQKWGTLVHLSKHCMNFGCNEHMEIPEKALEFKGVQHLWKLDHFNCVLNIGMGD